MRQSQQLLCVVFNVTNTLLQSLSKHDRCGLTFIVVTGGIFAKCRWIFQLKEVSNYKRAAIFHRLKGRSSSTQFVTLAVTLPRCLELIVAAAKKMSLLLLLT